MHLFLDMDGVLMDFSGHMAKRQPVWEGRQYHHLPRDQWTREETTRDALLHVEMADPVFWSTMPPMADAHELWTFCRTLDPSVLTATPARADYAARCAADKANSIREHFDSVFPQDKIHAVLRSQKASYAMGPHCVLVDDLLPNCLEWTAAGGTAILHTDAKTTISKLMELLHV